MSLQVFTLDRRYNLYSIVDRSIVRGRIYFCLRYTIPESNDEYVWTEQKDLIPLTIYPAFQRLHFFFNKWYHKDRSGEPPNINSTTLVLIGSPKEQVLTSFEELLGPINLNHYEDCVHRVARWSETNGYYDRNIGFIEKNFIDRRISLVEVWKKLYNEWNARVSSLTHVVVKDIISFQDDFGNTSKYFTTRNLPPCRVICFKSIDFTKTRFVDDRRFYVLIEFSTPRITPSYGVYTFYRTEGETILNSFI